MSFVDDASSYASVLSCAGYKFIVEPSRYASMHSLSGLLSGFTLMWMLSGQHVGGLKPLGNAWKIDSCCEISTWDLRVTTPKCYPLCNGISVLMKFNSRKSMETSAPFHYTLWIAYMKIDAILFILLVRRGCSYIQANSANKPPFYSHYVSGQCAKIRLRPSPICDACDLWIMREVKYYW